MAELPSKGKQPAKRHKPSRLRNEIHPDSTDDETGPEKHSVQEPHSDTVIPETQFEQNARFDVDNGLHNGSDYGESPLSPNSAAVLERNAVKKTTEVSASSPFTVKLLSKEAFGTADEPASSSSFSFSFGQRKAPSKTPPKDEAATTQSATLVSPAAPAMELTEGQALNDIRAAHPLPSPSEHVQRDVRNTDTSQHMNELPASNTARHGADVGHTGFELPEVTSDMPPSSHHGTGLANGTTKTTRTVKKGKKSKKGLLTQQRGGPWPPRSNNSMSRTNQVSVADHSVPDMSSPSGHQEFRVHESFDESTQASSATHNYREDMQGSATPASYDIDPGSMQYEQEVSDTVLHKQQLVSQSQPTASSQPILPVPSEQSSVVSFEQMPIAAPEQPPHALLEQPSVMTSEPTPHVSLKQYTLAPPPKGRSKFRPQSSNAQGYLPESAHQSHQPMVDMDAVQKPSSRHDAVEGTLHETSARGGPRRVGKPHKKVRTAAGPLPHHSQGTVVSSAIDRSLESLRIAMFADQFRKDQEHATEAKSYHESNAALQGQVSLQESTIADLKRRDQDHDQSVTRLTGKAKTNQKYVAGLEKDYEKLRRSVASFQDQSKRILEEKIAEVEREKDALRREFEVTLDVLAKSQKNMKSTVDDLYVRFRISESKKKSIAEDLSKQTVMYEEERRKRDELEKQLLSSVRSMQRQIGDSSTVLIDKLEILQSSVNDAVVGTDRDAEVKECLVILRNLKTTPFLTAKDAQKAEGMLRFVHEHVNSGIEAVSETVKSKDTHLDELQTFIKDQLQTLQVEILKYDDVVAENRKANESNDTLKKQLEAQQQHSQNLDDRIKALQQTEVDLKARSTQLEGELNEFRDKARDNGSEPIEFERGMADLRSQLKKAEDDVTAANAKAEHTEQLRQELEQETALYKTKYGKVRDILKQIDAEAKRKKKTENVVDLRKQIADDCQKEFREKESGFRNDIHRLTLERNEKEQAMQEQHNEVNAAKDQLQKLRKSVKSLQSELEAVRKERMDIEAKLETAQQTAQGSKSKPPEITALNEQLRQKVEELQCKERDNATLQRQYDDLSNRATELQGTHDHLQAQVSQHLSTIETLRRETDEQLSDARGRAQTALQLAQDQISDLRKEKEDLLSKHEQGRANEAKLNNAQATSAIERESLQQQVNELRAAKDAEDAEVHRVQANTAEEKRRLTDGHRTEIDDYNRRLMQTDAARKEAEAEVRRLKDEHQAKLASDHRVAEEKMQRVVEEYERKVREARAPMSTNRQQTSQSTPNDGVPSYPLQGIESGKNRKKVNRQNNSVLNIMKSSEITSRVAGPELPRPQRENAEHYFSLFEENDLLGDPFDEIEPSLVDAAAEPVPETQQPEGLLMSLEDFDESLSQVSRQGTKRRRPSSTELSTISSEEMREMEIETQRVSTSMLRGHERSSSKHGSFQKNARETPTRSDNASVSGSRSSRSHDRPRSQANTASRMMPPPGSTSHHFGPHSKVQDAIMAATTRGGLGQKASSSVTSSPEFMHPPSSVSKYTYGYHDSRHLPRSEHIQSAPRALEEGTHQKRKSSISPTEKDPAPKKQRTSSQSYPTNPSSGSRDNSPYPSKPSVVGSRSKMQPVPPPAATRSKAQPGSSNVPPHTPSHIPSSSGSYKSRSRHPSSSRTQTTDPARRTASRITRSKSRGGSAVYDDRFGQELDRR